MVDETRDGSGKSAGEPGDEGRMLARTWTIAANFHDPIEYGIPEAPTFTAEYGSDGSIALFVSDSEDAEPVLLATRSMSVRR
jgi:hypothetical protein